MRPHAAGLALGLGAGWAILTFLFGQPDDWTQLAVDALAVASLVLVGYGIVAGRAGALVVGLILLGSLMTAVGQ